MTKPRSNCGVRGYNGAERSHKGDNDDNDLEGSVCDSFAHGVIVSNETCS